MVKALSAFLDFCYLVRRDKITMSTLDEVEASLTDFHQYRQIFITEGIRENLSLPRQHSMVHYPAMIALFGSPAGLCSSITENKHIHAVKEVWRRSNRNDPLNQMVLANQRLNKLIASRIDFERRGMLNDTLGEGTWKTLRKTLRENSNAAAHLSESGIEMVQGPASQTRSGTVATELEETIAAEDFFDNLLANQEVNESADLDDSNDMDANHLSNTTKQTSLGGKNGPLSLITMASKRRE